MLRAEQNAQTGKSLEPITLMASIPGVEIDGARYLPATTPAFLEAFTRLPTRSGDIIICTWPKSGTTWTQNIVWEICHGNSNDSRLITERIPFIEAAVLEHHPNFASSPAEVQKIFNAMPSRRILKTHLAFDLAPKGSDQRNAPRYIYVMRNPKDAAVSFYHHYRNWNTIPFDGEWGDFFHLFMNNEVLWGSWFDHVLGWWKHKDDPRILFLKYEDMKKDLSGTIEKIAKFLDKDLPKKVVERIAGQTTFEAMRADNTVNYSWFSGLLTGDFLRKGKVGDWRRFFTPEQNALFDEIYATRMKGTELEFDFEFEN